MFQRILLSLLCWSAGPMAWGQVACWGQKVTDGRAVYQKLHQLKDQIMNDRYQDQQSSLRLSVQKEWSHINDRGLYDSNAQTLASIANSILHDGFYMYALPLQLEVIEKQFATYQNTRHEIMSVLTEYSAAIKSQDHGLSTDYQRLMNDYQNLALINQIQITCADQQQTIEFVDSVSGLPVKGPLQQGISYRVKLSSLIAPGSTPEAAELHHSFGKTNLNFQPTDDP